MQDMAERRKTRREVTSDQKLPPAEISINTRSLDVLEKDYAEQLRSIRDKIEGKRWKSERCRKDPFLCAPPTWVDSFYTKKAVVDMVRRYRGAEPRVVLGENPELASAVRDAWVNPRFRRKTVVLDSVTVYRSQYVFRFAEVVAEVSREWDGKARKAKSVRVEVYARERRIPRRW